jgi:tetratricopeptide (TPR) repeat protein
MMPTVKSSLVMNRTLTFLVVVAGLVVISWSLARSQGLSLTPALAEYYFGSVMDRTGASTDRLIESLQARLKTNPDDWQAYSQLGLTYLQKARETGDPTYYQKVEEALQKSLTLEPEDYTAVGAMGALALARHQFAEALVWGQHAQQLNPYRSYAYGVIADAQIELGRYQEAVQTLQTMVDLRPDLSAYTRISYARELHGDLAGALEMMQQAVDSGSPTPENAAWTRTQLAHLYFNRGNLDKAEIEYWRTLENYPGYIYALAGLGRVRAAQGQTEEAIELLTEATQKMPLPEFVMTLGDIYLATGQPDAAQKQYDLVQTMQKLYQANGVDVDLELALFEADHGRNPAETVKQARAVLARRPTNIHAADVLAWALYQAGEYQEAQAYSRQALRLGTQEALKFYHAGMIAYRLGDKLQARDYLKRALDLNPYFSILQASEARRTLEALAE